MQRKIIGFHLDTTLDWVAELECGHHQHVKNNPPLIRRDWVLTQQGREQQLGGRLDCSLCASVSSQSEEVCSGVTLV